MGVPGVPEPKGEPINQGLIDGDRCVLVSTFSTFFSRILAPFFFISSYLVNRFVFASGTEFYLVFFLSLTLIVIASFCSFST